MAEEMTRKMTRREKRVNLISLSKPDMTIHIISVGLLLILLTIIIIPLLNYFSLAFNDPAYNGNVTIFPIKFDFSHFAYIFQDKYGGFWQAFGNSVFITLVVTILSNLFAAMAAYPLSKKDCPFKSTILMYFVITMLFSAGTAPIYLLMRELKLLNNIWSVILISISNVTNMLFYKSFFENIPSSVEEAATIDGAGSLTMFFKVIVPMALPVFGSCCFFSIVGMWNGYGAAMIFIGTSEECQAAMPLAYYLYVMATNDAAAKIYDPVLLAAFENIQSASLLISIIPILFIYPYVIKYIKGGATLGSVKG